MPLDYDLEQFYDEDDFAVEGLTLGQTILGHFSNEYVELEGAEGRHPVFRVPLMSVNRDQVIAIEGRNYKIKATEPNGTGETLLILENA